MNHIDVFERLYRESRYELHPHGCPRFDKIHEWVNTNVPAGASILEVGVGRGGLMRMLLADGYNVLGTECVKFLIEHDLKKLYDSFKIIHILGKDLWAILRYFDAVICTDVLEHLESEEAAKAVLHDLAHHTWPDRPSWLVVTVGLTEANANTQIDLDFRLHALSHDPAWWLAAFEEVAEVEEMYNDGQSVYFFGRRKP